MSKSENFSVEILASAGKGGLWLPPGLMLGRVTIGDFVEEFRMKIGFWDESDYCRSWRESLRFLESDPNAVSCLVASMVDPSAGNFVTCWPLYRSGETVFVRNSIIFLDDLAEKFSPVQPWCSVRPRSVVNEDGQRISEWSIDMESVRNFLEGFDI